MRVDIRTPQLHKLLTLLLLLTFQVTAVRGSMDAAYLRAGTEMDALVAREFDGILVGRQSTQNLQTFTGALGDISASAITDSGNAQHRYLVDGNTFTDFQSAASRACSDQHNSCADLANSNKNAGFTVGDCDTQQTSCTQTAASATQTAFQVKVSSDAQFDYFCDE